MKTNKGFTLIELLAVIVILGIVMAIAIPGINAVINNTRKNAFVSDAKMYADGLRTGILGEQFDNPTATTAVAVRLGALELEKGGDKSSYGAQWEDAYVVAALDSDGKIIYYFAGNDKSHNYVTLTNVEVLTSSNIQSGSTRPATSVVLYTPDPLPATAATKPTATGWNDFPATQVRWY